LINPTLYTQIASEIYFIKPREKITNNIVGFPAMPVKIEGFYKQEEGSHF